MWLKSSNDSSLRKCVICLFVVNAALLNRGGISVGAYTKYYSRRKKFAYLLFTSFQIVISNKNEVGFSVLTPVCYFHSRPTSMASGVCHKCPSGRLVVDSVTITSISEMTSHGSFFTADAQTSTFYQ